MSTITQINSFDQDSFKTFFKYEQIDEDKLVKCINAYKDGFSGNIFSRVWNAVCSIFGYSDWQQARSALKPHVYEVIKREYSCEPEKVMQNRAHALSEFVVRFLVTRASIGQLKPQYYIEQAVYHSVASDPSASLLEQAAYGNGQTLGKSPRESYAKEAIDNRNELEKNSNDDAFMTNRAKDVFTTIGKWVSKSQMLDGKPLTEDAVKAALPEIIETRIAMTAWIEEKEKVDNALMKDLHALITPLSSTSVFYDMKDLRSRLS